MKLKEYTSIVKLEFSFKQEFNIDLKDNEITEIEQSK